MDHFIKFEPDVDLETLGKTLEDHNPGIMILRYSKLTGTVKVRVNDKLSKRDIKKAFSPHKIKHIYSDFPVKGSSI